MSSFSERSPSRVERGQQRRHEAVDGERPSGRGGGGRRGGTLEIELALRRCVAVGDAHAGVPHHELLEQVAALGRVEEVGGQRGVECQAPHVDVEAGERPHERLGLVGRQRSALVGSERAERVAPDGSPSSGPGIQTTSPALPSRTSAMPSSSERPSAPVHAATTASGVPLARQTGEDLRRTGRVVDGLHLRLQHHGVGR